MGTRRWVWDKRTLCGAESVTLQPSKQQLWGSTPARPQLEPFKENESVLVHISPSFEKQRFCTVITPSSALGTEALPFWHLEAPRGLPWLGKMDKNCANPMN